LYVQDRLLNEPDTGDTQSALSLLARMSVNIIVPLEKTFVKFAQAPCVASAEVKVPGHIEEKLANRPPIASHQTEPDHQFNVLPHLQNLFPLQLLVKSELLGSLQNPPLSLP